MPSGIQATAGVLLTIAIVVPLALLWFAVIIDLFKRDDLSVFRKALWATLVILAVHVGVLLYFVFRPVPEPPGKDLAVTADRSSMIVTSLERLRTEHRAGGIDDTEYLETKRELLGVS
jgi:RsiW-degrading membrane proteinase PrsW (M82 family)